ncbi:hypothetical protein LYSHEL_04100 [Lysobacter helvus]|uniref:Type II secretion system protein GspB C-terminal domain-containing protein n=2 Tax=Lysobacteraceae TaxID=32033 RepID=A0ABM7Q2G4_9GAMM|nr:MULTISPECIES: general secretion pathway protein GspB [Lysobacter]BCT91386.1 hypothetical protein LYSCAS_04100 [Lysobacter caseinilyticus]BCT94539.1 hypothetical protein LYSHEL_04100 [Lysobacter helvus]
MSLILEALRKSEAERRRAQVPDLLAEPQPAAPVARRAAPRWPLWIAAALVALVPILVMLRNEPAQPVDGLGTKASVPVQDVAISSDVAAIDRPAPRPAPAIKRPLVIAPPAPAAPTTHTAAPTVAAVATPPPPPPRALPAPPTPAPSPVVQDNYERVTDLGPDERKALPPLKFSMHMWNDVPAQRFVIIDGTRLVVGDHLGPLVVADILSDGVLLDWNGRALKLPLR